MSGKIQELIPDPISSRKIFHYIQQTEIGGKKIKLSDLNPDEKLGLNAIRNIFKQFEDTLQDLDEPILKNIRDNYLPIIWSEYRGFNPSQFADMFDTKVYGPTKSFKFAKKRIYDTINEGLKKVLGLNLAWIMLLNYLKYMLLQQVKQYQHELY